MWRWRSENSLTGRTCVYTGYWAVKLRLGLEGDREMGAAFSEFIPRMMSRLTPVHMVRLAQFRAIISSHH